YLPLVASGSSRRRYSGEISYQPPSWKSTTARLFQLMVTTRPIMPLKRCSSGRSGSTSTYWSVHWRRSASLISSGDLALVCSDAAMKGRFLQGRQGYALGRPARFGGAIGVLIASAPNGQPLPRSLPLPLPLSASRSGRGKGKGRRWVISHPSACT